MTWLESILIAFAYVGVMSGLCVLFAICIKTLGLGVLGICAVFALLVVVVAILVHYGLK